MTWDSPVWLIAALALPIIILLHLLARRRKTVRVPSLLLWDRLMENERRSVVLRRFLADILLILQLAAAAFLVLSLAGPGLRGRGQRLIGPTVIAVDVSAGMEPRFEEAREAALDLVRGKAYGAEVLILAAGAEALPVTGFTESRSELQDAVRRLSVTDLPGDPVTALRAAEALAAAKVGGRAVFITDGAFDRAPVPSPRTEIVLVGRAGDRGRAEDGRRTGIGSSDNAGITAFAVRGIPGGGRELLVAAELFGASPAAAELTVSADGRTLLSETLVLEPGAPATRTAAWYDPLAGRAEAHLAVEGGDALAADDTAFAVLSSGGRLHAALLTKGNWFLETLLSTHPALETDVFVGAEEWDAAEGPWDIVIADRLFPEEDPGGALLAVYPFDDSPNPPLPLAPRGVLADADPVRWDSSHPAMKGADLARVSVRSAADLAAAPGTRVLAESRGGPLVLAGETAGRRWAALSFDVMESSLPLRPAFPIMISGLLSWLVPGDLDAAAESFRTGEAWQFDSADPNGKLTVTDPDGKKRDLLSERGAVLLDKVGFWTVETDSGIRETGVNLLDAGESNLSPRWNPAGPEVSIELGAGRGAEPEAGPAAPSRRLTAILLIAAVAFLFAEWALQVRQWGAA